MDEQPRSSASPKREWALRYALAVAAVAVGSALRLEFTRWVGPGLPTYVTFYPAVMTAALLAGFWPGLLATALSGLTTAYWILAPAGLAIHSPVDRLGLAIFTGMGLFMSVVAELYRRDRDKAAAYDREAALREGQARLLSAVTVEKEKLACLISSIADEVWFADTSRKFTLANPSAVREFGLKSAEDFDVEKLAASLEVLRADGSPRPVEEAPPLRALAGEVIRGEEEIIRSPGTGQLQYRQVSASPVRDAEGRIIGSVSIARDVTDRRRAEDALRQSEERFRSLAEALPQIVWTADPEGGVEWFNRRWHEFTGEPEGAGKGWSWGNFMHKDDLARSLENWASARREGSLYENESRLRGRLGEYRWFLVRAWPLRGSDGCVIRWFGSCTDIQGMKAAEAALRESEQRLKFHFENSPLAVIEWNADFVVTQWSSEAERMFGWKKGETLGKRIDGLRMIYDEDIPIVSRTMERLASGKELAIVS